MKKTIRSLVVLGLLVVAPANAGDDSKKVHVYKSPTCGCCQKWVDHLKDAGFTVDVSNVPDVGPVRKEMGVPPQASSCHTAVVGGYFVEGHVPAKDVSRLLAEKPKDVVGITVPGMPIGSPGMEGPNAVPYSSFAVQKSGKLVVFANHEP